MIRCFIVDLALKIKTMEKKSGFDITSSVFLFEVDLINFVVIKMSGLNGTTAAPQLQPHGKHIPRRQCIPILYTKGTHYDVGFDVVIFDKKILLSTYKIFFLILSLI